MLFLGLGGSTIIFLFMVAMLLFRKLTIGMPPISIPLVFWFTTLLIALSSGTLWLSMDYFKRESYNQFINWLGITGAFGLVFATGQIIGAYQMYSSGLNFTNPAFAFLIIISGLHFIHLIVGLAIMTWTLLDAQNFRNYVDGFIESLNPSNQTRLRLLVWFWHFLDFLWIILFTVFIIFLS